MSAKIFVNYRREDTSAEAGRLVAALKAQFGDESTFMDTTMAAGTTWPDALHNALMEANTVLVLIGPDWLRVGSDEWGQRRIDDEKDWVRLEIETALENGKRVIPTLVNGGKLPPSSVLPEKLSDLGDQQKIEIRRDYWDHDIKLLLSQMQVEFGKRPEHDESFGPYAKPPPKGSTAKPINDEELLKVLENEVAGWKKIVTPLPENPSDVRVEISREFKFKTFQDAVNFMHEVAPGCDVAIHHPRWENIWKTVRVYLTTWDIGHRVSDRDIQLAKYFDRAYRDFPGAA